MQCPKRNRCPVVQHIESELRSYRQQRDHLRHIVMNHLEDVIESSIIVEGTSDPARHTEPVNIHSFIRQKFADDLNQVDATIERGMNALEQTEAGCNDGGPLTMRASKGDTTYTVTACTSHGLPNDPGEPVNVDRQVK